MRVTILQQKVAPPQNGGLALDDIFTESEAIDRFSDLILLCAIPDATTRSITKLKHVPSTTVVRFNMPGIQMSYRMTSIIRARGFLGETLI